MLPAQDFTFSQFQALPFLINPAETGSFSNNIANTFSETARHRLTGIFRTHWDTPGTEHDLFGSAVGWDTRVCGRNDGFWSFGGYVQHDGTSNGGLYNLQARATASYHQQLDSRTWLAAGVALGGLQYGIRPEKLLFNDQYDPNAGQFNPGLDNGESFDRLSRTDIDADAGGRLILRLGELKKSRQSDWASFGVAFHHLLQPAYTFFSDNDDRPANFLPVGFSVQGALQWRGWWFNGLLRRHSFAEGKQWQTMAGGGLTIQTSSKTRIVPGAMVRFSTHPDGPYRISPSAGILFVRLDLDNCIVRFSYDLNHRRLFNRGAVGLELSCTWLWGEGKCPLGCP